MTVEQLVEEINRLAQLDKTVRVPIFGVKYDI